MIHANQIEEENLKESVGIVKKPRIDGASSPTNAPLPKFNKEKHPFFFVKNIIGIIKMSVWLVRRVFMHMVIEDTR